MASAIARRLSKLETIASPPPAVPHVIKVDTLRGETKTEAMARFSAQYAGHVRRGHRVLVVPRRVCEEDRELFADKFKEQQTRLVAEARDQRLKEEGNNDNDNTGIFARQHGRSRRVQSASNVADTAQHIAWRPRRLRE